MTARGFGSREKDGGKKGVDIQTGLWYKLVVFRSDRNPKLNFESAVVGPQGRYVQDFHNERR